MIMLCLVFFHAQTEIDVRYRHDWGVSERYQRWVGVTQPLFSDACPIPKPRLFGTGTEAAELPCGAELVWPLRASIT